MKKYLKQSIGIPLAAQALQGVSGTAAQNAAKGLESYSAGFPAMGALLGAKQVLKATKKLAVF